MSSFDMNNSGLRLLKPSSNSSFGGLLLLLVRAVISGVFTVLAFNLIFKGLNIQCDFALMSKLIFGTTFAVTLVQLNTAVLVVALAIFSFRLYKYVLANTELLINGAKAVANQCYPILSQALNLPQADGFDSVSDYVVTLNQFCAICAVIMAIAVALVIVVVHSRLLHTIMLAMIYAVLAFFDCTVDYGYAIGLIISYIMAFTLAMSGIADFRLNILPFIISKFRKVKSFKGNALYVIQTGIICSLLAFCATFAFSNMYSNEKFAESFSKEYSQNIKLTARDIAVMKYAEYKKYRIAEKLSMGQLGYMSYVKQNVKEEASSLKTESIKEGKLYFRSFIGEKYNYRYNTWIETTDDDSVFVNALKANGANERKFMFYSGYTRNKLVPVNSIYRNYENNDDFLEVTAYDYEPVVIADEVYNKYVNDNYLYIDDENKKVIDEICTKQGFNKADGDLDNKIAKYMNSDFTYVTEPSGVPYGKDFVNYFLQDSKTGNFIHYATAMTLIYRNLGIPARYVSGYAIEAKQTWEKRPDITGQSVVRIKKGNLYSWVEVYDQSKGWRIVDNIPAPTLEELIDKYEAEGDNYTPDTSLDSYFRTVDKEKYTPSNVAKVGGKILLKLLLAVLAFVLVILLLTVLVTLVYKYVLYVCADNSKKAYILMEYTKKRIKSKAVTYKDMETDLAEKYGSKKAKDIIALAERCIFAENVTNENIKKLEMLLFK